MNVKCYFPQEKVPRNQVPESSSLIPIAFGTGQAGAAYLDLRGGEGRLIKSQLLSYKIEHEEDFTGRDG